ncbi:hypothetical protein [Scandinavium goeteborgense]|uniref:hypothetical protein n=1 Tax=Scandinavium goeteborgense TaxID=1851514 RepID=UPI000F6641B9|nr:hypothetical protein [Scandinavium goeteborgense]QKN80803.1 hypothetical protein A8O29_005700 [Scandinavium goeteborgense]
MKINVLALLLIVSFQGYATDFTCSESAAFPYMKKIYNSDTVYHVKENPKTRVLTLQVTSNIQYYDPNTKAMSPVVRNTGDKFYAKHLEDNRWIELNPTVMTDSEGKTLESDPLYFEYNDENGTFNVFVMNGNGGLTLDQECLEVE